MSRKSSHNRLSQFAETAKKLGADEAKVVSTRDIVVDKRVRLKCAVPRCSDYDNHLLCPPNLISVDEFSEILNLYKHAIIVQVEADTDSSDKSRESLGKAGSRRLELSTNSARWQRKLHVIINQLETLAFKDGYYLAAGLIGGSCCLCRTCVGSFSEKPCRHPFEARPSMEAVGIDVIRTCQKVGMPIHLSSESRVRWTGMVLLD